MDKVRRQEHKALMKEGVEDLKGTKYDWLIAPGNLSRKKQISFKKLRSGTYKTARAWHLKHTASHLWHYSSRTWAKKGWKKWLSWAVRCRLDPMKAVAKIRQHHLSAGERHQINALREQGLSIRAIAKQLAQSAFKRCLRTRGGFLFGLNVPQCSFPASVQGGSRPMGLEHLSVATGGGWSPDQEKGVSVSPV